MNSNEMSIVVGAQEKSISVYLIDFKNFSSMAEENHQKFSLNETAESIRKIIENNLKNQTFDEKSADRWSRKIVGATQNYFFRSKKHLKTFVSATILPKSADNSSLFTACFWNLSVDGSAMIK